MKKDIWQLSWDETSIQKFNWHLLEHALQATFAGTFTEPFNFFKNESRIGKPNITYSPTIVKSLWKVWSVKMTKKILSQYFL